MWSCRTCRGRSERVPGDEDRQTGRSRRNRPTVAWLCVCVRQQTGAQPGKKKTRTFCTPSQQERVELQPVHCRHGLVSDASVISSFFVFHTGRRRLTFWCFGREVPLFFFCFANVYKRPTLFITFGRNSAPTGSDIVDRQNMWLRYVFHRSVIFECLQVKKSFY